MTSSRLHHSTCTCVRSPRNTDRFTRTGHWYEQPAGGFRLVMEAMAPIGAAALLEAEHPLKPRALTRALERLFTSRLESVQTAS